MKNCRSRTRSIAQKRGSLTVAAALFLVVPGVAGCGQEDPQQLGVAEDDLIGNSSHESREEQLNELRYCRYHPNAWTCRTHHRSPPPATHPDMEVREVPDMAERHEPDLEMHQHPADMAEPIHLPDMTAPHHSPDLAEPPSSSPDTVQPTLFGMHIHDASTKTSWPATEFGAWRLWDSHTQWALVNPSKGSYDWSTLDKLVALAQQHGIELSYTFALTPQWASARPSESCDYSTGNCAEPANIADFTTFVTALVTRYKGKIKNYEGWNEPNLGQFYSGTPQKLVALQQTLYKTVKSIDPSARVVSPSMTSLKNGGSTYFDEFLTAGGAGYFDVIGCHLYSWPSAPDSIDFGSGGNLAAIKSVIAKHNLSSLPIWNTESGWNTGPLGATTVSGFIARMYILGWANGVDRYYFYAWDDGAMGVETNNVANVAGKSIGVVYGWMVGAELSSCTLSSNVYTCALTRSGGYEGTLVWSTSSSSTYHLPAGSKTEKHLDGTSTSLGSATSITVNGEPVLVQNE